MSKYTQKVVEELGGGRDGTTNRIPTGDSHDHNSINTTDGSDTVDAGASNTGAAEDSVKDVSHLTNSRDRGALRPPVRSFGADAAVSAPLFAAPELEENKSGANNRDSSSGAVRRRDLRAARAAATAPAQRNSADGGIDYGASGAGAADVVFEKDDDGEESDGASAGSPPQQQKQQQQQLYSCDHCPHAFFTSAAALERHALETHAEALFPDYAALRRMCDRLHAQWEAVVERKRDVIRGQWGRKVFAIAAARDGGAARMAVAHRAREQLEAVVRHWHPSARVFVFGSSVAFGVWDGVSDIDFTVIDVALAEQGLWPPLEKNAVRSLTELLRRAGFSYVNLEPIAHARVPILKHHASTPIALTRAPGAAEGRGGDGGGDEEEEGSRWEAEQVVARSVRLTLSAPATREDRMVLEGSLMEALAPSGASVQQLWWDRRGVTLCATLSDTTAAVRATVATLAVATPSLRVRAQPLHEEHRPELYGLDFDLSFRTFGIRNSQLLQRYLRSHPCARPGALVLKDWSKTSGVNNSVNGYLTSYAVNIMWIYYLVRKGVVPYIDPVADVPASLVGFTAYAPPHTPIVDPAWTAAQREEMCAQAGELLVGFFHFYTFEFDWENHVVSLNRRGITTKAMLGWDQEDVGSSGGGSSNSGGGGAGSGATTTLGGARRAHAVTRYALCIEDPYEENLNLGRHMGVTKSLKVKGELCRALVSLLKDPEDGCCVFAATDEHRRRQRRDAADDGRDGAELKGAGGERRPAEEERELAEGGEAALAAATFESGSGLLCSAAELRRGEAGRRLPLRVLYRLMAVAVTAVAESRRQHEEERRQRALTLTLAAEGEGEDGARAAAPTADVSAPVAVFPAARAAPGGLSAAASAAASGEWPGMPVRDLMRELHTRAAVELKVAGKAWNYQQLLFRLGYTVQHGMVRPRRQRGLRGGDGLAGAPSGVLPAAAAASEAARTALTGPTSAADASVAELNREALAAATAAGLQTADPNTAAGGGGGGGGNDYVAVSAPPRTLTEAMAQHLSEGFLRLTPEWVAWSVPWAARHVRGHALFTPAPGTTAAGAGTRPSPSSSSAAPPPPRQQQPQRHGASAGGGAGGLRRTPPVPMRSLGIVGAVRAILRRGK